MRQMAALKTAKFKIILINRRQSSDNVTIMKAAGLSSQTEVFADYAAARPSVLHACAKTLLRQKLPGIVFE